MWKIYQALAERNRTLSRIWEFLFAGWISSVFADCQVILKLIIKPSKPEPWGHFPIVQGTVEKVSLSNNKRHFP